MSGYLSDKLQKVQNRGARVITQSPFETSSNLLLAMLKREKLSLRRKKTESFHYTIRFARLLIKCSVVEPERQYNPGDGINKRYDRLAFYY